MDVINNTTKATNSTVDVISSKIDAIDLGFKLACSTVDIINSTVDVISSKIDAIDLGSNCCSTVDVINSTVDIINSKIDTIAGTGICGSTAINGSIEITSSGNYCVAS